MVVASDTEVLKTVRFFNGLSEEELGLVAEICKKGTFQSGELCQKEGVPDSRVNVIVKGQAGVEFHLSNVAFGNKDIVLYTLKEGDVFGWTSLINSAPWSSLRALEPIETLAIESDELLQLCETNTHIGYVIMKNLASLIASRFRRQRMATLNTLVSIKGEC
jgi:CRP/FNR family transcriptional regulator, cyclic AMP receptor protein